MKYPIFLEKDNDSDYGVTVPDLPGCFSAGETVDNAINNANEAILTHIEGMIMDDEIIPMPSTIEDIKSQYPDKDYFWAICDVDTGKISENTKRVNITIPEKLLSKIDTYAKNEGETRSGFIAHAAMEYISKRSV